MRTITVITPQKNDPLSHTSAASSWGQLKGELSSKLGGSLANYVATVKETRNTLAVDMAQLPQGNFTLFLTQNKIQAGGNS